MVYLIKKIDEEWLYGTCAGVEGMFPCNYVNVVLPLPEDNGEEAEVVTERPQSGLETRQISDQVFFADALYTFDAEADGDLSLRVSNKERLFFGKSVAIKQNYFQVGDMVKIFGRLNEDWLYGEVAGKVGQFPTTFVHPVPPELPIIPT